MISIELKNVAYCKLNLSFDHETFVKEYDRYILPNSVPIANGDRSWEKTKDINSHWKMVEPESYDLCDIQGETGIIKRGIEQWMATSLIELVTTNETLLSLSRSGSVAVRNNVLDKGEYKFKETYNDLNIVKWIKELPIKKIIGVRCVSLKPGSFASIHRDENNFDHHKKGTSLPTNLLWDSGFISITINITDGGQPLFYSLNSEVNKPFKINDDVYLFNDFCPHGVPIVSSRRRQIRVTGIPTDEIYKLIDLPSVHYIT
jgi:hypothetical protein